MAGNAFNKGQGALHAGIGIGFAGLFGVSDLPPITLAYEAAIQPKIGIGGIVGYTSSSFDGGTSGTYSYKYKYTYIIVGARGNYHFLEDNEKFDAYGGVTLGYNIVSSSITETGTKSPFFTPAAASASFMLFGGHLGGRYYFSPKFGLYAEAGYGIGYINAGVVLKL